MNWNLPNILTLLRLLAAPGVAVMFLYFARPWADWFALILFLCAAITDFLDGYLARAWKQESRFGAMLDPIADKAMVVIALMVISVYSSIPVSPIDVIPDPFILLPATAIIFREVFISGLREFLGESSKLLSVTKLAKWKTTAQMIAIAILFSKGIFYHHLLEHTVGMDQQIFNAIMAGELPDEFGLRWTSLAHEVSWWGGVVLLWIAAALTLLTGWDYLRKAMPYLKDDK